ncbi:DNA-binding transcriptional regulator OxyR [Vibrio sp.]|nr:DNA-binding transcriptional regulator OxyR [Vibrio sp.]
MNIRDFEYLVALEKHKHFRKAAEACFVSQPTLSGQIKKLEEELGSTLLERNNRTVLFTHSGLALVDQAKKILQEVKTFKLMANGQADELSGPMHIGFIPTVGPYVLPRIIPSIQQQYPDLEMHLYEDQTRVLVQKLQQGELDCLILASVAETQPFREIKLFEEKLCLATSKDHPWSQLNSFNVELLNNEEVLTLGEGHCLRDQALGYCFAAGARENKHFKATSLETLKNMVQVGMGVTLLPELSVRRQDIADSLNIIENIEPQPTRQLVLAYRPGSALKKRFEKLSEAIIHLLN